MIRGTVGLLALSLCACSSVKMVQRDNCWVRETETFPFQHKEELGPCARETPSWAQDRLTRLVQECMAQADYRWQNRALQAWEKGEPLPAQASEEEVLSACMNEASTSVVAENENLKSRIGEVTSDRESLRAENTRNVEHLRSSHELVATALGEAAKKPAPNAVATATSNGTATTQSDSNMASTQPQGGTAPVAILGACMPGVGGSGPVTPSQMSSAPSPVKKKAAPMKATESAKSAAPECEPGPTTAAADPGLAKAGTEKTVPAPVDPEKKN